MSLLRHLPRFRALEQRLGDLADREQWSRTRLDEFQLERLNALWAHAREHVPHYRDLATDRSLPDQFGDLGEFSSTVPVLDKALVRDKPEQFFSDEAAPGGWHRTGGSTGIPMRVYWEHTAHRQSLQIRYRSEQARGVGVFDRHAFLWGHGASLAPGWRGGMARVRRAVEDRLRRRIRLSAYQVGPDDLASHLQRMGRFQPVCLYGYSSAVNLLAEAAEAAGTSVPSLRLVTLSAEPAHPWIVEQVGRGFGAPVLIEYGSVECGNMAISDESGRLRVREDHVLLETVEREDGRFDVIVTVLYNPSFPLIRYRIEDVTEHALNRPTAGFAWLDAIGGRDNDFLWTATGGRVHPQAVKHVVEHLPVRRFTARQSGSGLLTLMVEADRDLPPSDVDRTTHLLQEMLGGLPIRVETHATLPSSPAGKHRWVIADPPSGSLPTD
ncbi:MAG: phenylacetate--CoA ligase family protein [Acidimicrobiia bacterium]|nr:hypothetical protein [Acidimicrobiia bacterium]NNF10882.1 phenylacetate--CoA ligase family protein [Acidimicrobiia bacterium]